MNDDVVVLALDLIPGLTNQANAAIDNASRDVIERPYLAKPRTVTIEVSIEPDVDPQTNNNYPAISFKVSTKTPGLCGRKITGFVENGKIVVSSLSYSEQMELPTNISQLTIAQEG